MEGIQSDSQTTFGESSYEPSLRTTADPLVFDVEQLPRPYPLQLVHLYEDDRCGELNGVSCSLGQFFGLLESCDKKLELLDGQIVCVTPVMCDRQSEVRDAAAAEIRNCLRNQGLLDQYDVRVEVKLDPTQQIRASSRGRQHKLEKVFSALVPDFLVQAIIETGFQDTLFHIEEHYKPARIWKVKESLW